MVAYLLRVRMAVPGAGGQAMKRLSINQVTELIRDMMMALRSERVTIHDTWWSRETQSLTMLLSATQAATDLEEIAASVRISARAGKASGVDAGGEDVIATTTTAAQPAGQGTDDVRVRAPWHYLADNIGSDYATTELGEMGILSPGAVAEILRVCAETALYTRDGSRRDQALRPVWLVTSPDTLSATDAGLSVQHLAAGVGCAVLADPTAPSGYFALAFSPQGYGSLDVVTCRWFHVGDGNILSEDIDPEKIDHERSVVAAFAEQQEGISHGS